MTNPTELNPRFGTADDLKYLIAEVHKRDMYIMVDIGPSSSPSPPKHASRSKTPSAQKALT